MGSVEEQTPDLFCKTSVLKNLANFTGKCLCWSLFLQRDSDTGVFL